MNYNTILIDGDIIINKACFAAQSKGKSVSTVYSIIDGLTRQIQNELMCYDYYFLIGPPKGSKTFRHRVAVTQEYKGNRKDTDRPDYLEEAREYVLKKHLAIASEDMEADDMIGIMLTEEEGRVAASVDKDLLQVPGWHYNIDKKEVLYARDPGTLGIEQRNNGRLVLRGTGFKWFCAQMLLGDDSDNIAKPTKGLGPRKIFNLLNKLDSKEKLWYAISKAYEKSSIDIDENARLLWILRDNTTTYLDYIGEMI